MRTKNKNYKAYADIYDDFKGDRAPSIQFIKSLIEKYHPKARSVLDLACGTGSMAQGLAEDYSVVGLDNSPHMLKKAQQKASNIQLIHGDITSFTLDGKFDVVTCLHNSVNHLQTFEDWMNLFRMVSQHLQPRGIFIFDINPPERMESMVAYGPSTRQIDDRYLIIQVFHDKTPGSYIWVYGMLRSF